MVTTASPRAFVVGLIARASGRKRNALYLVLWSDCLQYGDNCFTAVCTGCRPSGSVCPVYITVKHLRSFINTLIDKQLSHSSRFRPFGTCHPSRASLSFTTSLLTAFLDHSFLESIYLHWALEDHYIELMYRGLVEKQHSKSSFRLGRTRVYPKISGRRSSLRCRTLATRKFSRRPPSPFGLQ